MFHSFPKAVQLQVHWNLVPENHMPEKQQPWPLGIGHMGPSSCLQRKKKKRAGDVLCRARSWTPMILLSAFQFQLFYDSTSAIDCTGLTEAHLLFWTSVRPEWGMTLRRAQAHTPQALHRTRAGTAGMWVQKWEKASKQCDTVRCRHVCLWHYP